MSARRACLFVAAVLVVGCGGEDSPRKSAPDQDRANAITCADLPDRAAASRVAARLVDRIAAYEESRQEVRATIARSLLDTCRQPKLPGVEDPADYRPVEPVLDAVQAHLDEEALYE